ncbi:MAG: hypothetical protein WA417_10255 [Stellaceae bacterium]
MKLSALIRTAAIAGLVLVGSARLAPAQVCTGGHLNAVPFVVTGYAPATNTTPTPQTRPVNSDVQMDLAKAFAAASPDFQYKLCGLDGIFIDPSGCQDPGSGNPYDPTTCDLNGAPIAGYSWGLRTYPPNPYTRRYIGLSLALWNYMNPKLPKKYRWSCAAPQNVCAPPFSSFYAAFLDAVVHVPAQNSPNGSFSVVVTPKSFAASPAMSVLAVLAHEFGHVYWFDSFVPNAGGSFANTFCGGIFYPGANWGTSPVNVPYSGGHRFVFFGDTSTYSGSHVPWLPGTLHSIYSSGNWASALAAFSPNEDFVETFELSVLMKVGLKGLKINTDFIVPVPNGSWLAWKIGCFH